MRGQLKDLKALEHATKALDSSIGHPHMYVCMYVCMYYACLRVCVFVCV